MKIKFIQKTTLIDYPDKVACTLFVHGCNFKCGFCHNPELVLVEGSRDLSKEEVLSFLDSRKNYLDGVCITGGEPLMNIDSDLLRKAKSMGYLIKIDTNGSFPNVLQGLVSEGLVDYVAMDVKIDKENYEKITNAYADIGKLERSMKIISTLPDYEFRTTILECFHNEENMTRMMEWITSVIGSRIKRFSLQGFKNKGKFINKNFVNEKDTSLEYLEKLKKVIEPYAEIVEVKF